MKTEKLQLRITEEAKKALKEIANTNCRSMSAQIEYWVKKEQEKTK